MREGRRARPLRGPVAGDTVTGEVISTRIPAATAARAPAGRRPEAAARELAAGHPMSPANALAIQRSAGNAALSRMLGHTSRSSLQRAVIAVDGTGEGNPTSAPGRATRACLWNLTQHKRSKDKSTIGNFGGDARGKVAGPAELSALAIGPGLLGSETESLYILAHGSRYSRSIGGMSPKEMAKWLKAGFAGVKFRGKVKLVSCHSASDSSHRKPGDAPDVYKFPGDRSYAQELARLLAPSSKTDPFQPATVQGITGIGWVDETTGRLTKIDKNIYDAATAHMASNSDVGALAGTGKFVNPFTDVSDPTARATALNQWFGAEGGGKRRPDQRARLLHRAVRVLGTQDPGRHHARDRLHRGQGPHREAHLHRGIRHRDHLVAPTNDETRAEARASVHRGARI